MSQLQENQLFANRYRLVKKLGSGAFSEVWKAEDAKAGNLVVAIKIYAPDKGMDEDGIAIFSQEYALVFNVTHQNLLRPNHFDNNNGSPFLVLPYCSKGSVLKMLGTNPSEQELVTLLRDVASGLAYLHKQNPPIIHQDIKPDNILITESGEYKLTDFGISTRIRSTLRRSVGNTSNAGTMAYMAPERFERNPAPIMASDIWSLGATLFELMTDDAPFGNLGGVSLKSGAEIPEVGGNYSNELKQLVEACLAKDPWNRPTALQLKEWCDEFLKIGLRNHSTPPPIPPQPENFSSKTEIITSKTEISNSQNNNFTDSSSSDNKTPPPVNEPPAPKGNFNKNIVITIIVVVSIVVILFLFFLVKSCNHYIEDDYNNTQEEETVSVEVPVEEPVVDEVEQAMSALRDKYGPIRITKVSFANADENGNVINNYGSELYGSKVKFLTPKIEYENYCSESQSLSLKVKLIDPDGDLITGNNSPNGYSYSVTIETIGNYATNDSDELPGWGSSSGGSYHGGTYRFEIWYNGDMIFYQNIYLQSTSVTKTRTVTCSCCGGTGVISQGYWLYNTYVPAVFCTCCGASGITFENYTETE